MNSLKIQWNHLAYKDTFCCNVWIETLKGPPSIRCITYLFVTLVHIFQLLCVNFKNLVHCNIINKQWTMGKYNITTWFKKFKYNIRNNLKIWINSRISSSLLKSNQGTSNHFKGTNGLYKHENNAWFTLAKF